MLYLCIEINNNAIENYGRRKKTQTVFVPNFDAIEKIGIQ